MRPINCNYRPKNEYTIPLEGVPYYQNSGIIYACGKNGEKYAVSRIEYERFDEQNFQYIFTPEWNVIDFLPDSTFQGIPGLDMSMRLKHYYRVNMTPYFISERTPGENREDLAELLESVGLDYYDRFEWLLRSNMRCGIDNLTVERAVSARKIRLSHGNALPDNLQPDDSIIIEGFEGLASTDNQLRHVLLTILRSGAQIWDDSENRYLSEEEHGILLRLLLAQEAMDKRQKTHVQKQGIEQAKKAEKYTGRKKREIDKHLLIQVSNEFENRKITEKEAMQRLNISSRSTFYRRLKEIKQPEDVKMK